MPTSAKKTSAGHGLRLIKGQRPFEGASDSELIAAFYALESGAAEELYERLIGVVNSTLIRMLGSRVPEHEDLVQHTLEQIVLTLRRRTFEQTCKLTSWAAAITSNVALNAIRARQSERRRRGEFQPEGEAPVISSQSDVHAEVAARRDLAKLRQALAAMKPERARPIVYHDVLGHTLREAAEMLGLSVPALQSRLERGRRELRARFDAIPSREPEVDHD